MVKVGLGYPVDWGHAASAATRLISASNLIFHSRQKIVTSAYHFEITSEVSEMGMKNSFSNTLLQSVNVMANATIHSVPLDKMLHRNTKKNVMQWHSQPDNIPHAPPQTYSELLATSHKDEEPAAQKLRIRLCCEGRGYSGMNLSNIVSIIPRTYSGKSEDRSGGE
jgi:hypothetical protein